jgi:5-methylcytosine-specific restriction protein A
MNIPKTAIPILYKISQQFFNGELDLTAARDKVGENGINKNTGRDYIYAFKGLLKGDEFKRTINAASMDYYLEHILEDYGTAQLHLSLISFMLHIEYYEGSHSVTMHELRKVHMKYLAIISSKALVTDVEQILSNLRTLEGYLERGTYDEKAEAARLIQRGTCFVAYRIEEETRFAPSRFIGYRDNDFGKYGYRHGTDTNNAIKKILKSEPSINSELETLYRDYCESIGVKYRPHGGTASNKRKYWRLGLPGMAIDDEQEREGYSEGRMSERMHRARERNSTVISLAKQRFREKNGRLYCEVCEFDFNEWYDEDFIEGHHKIFVKDMPPDHKTKPEEIAMLCSNCHRMIHKRYPWPSVEEFTKAFHRRRQSKKIR